MNAKQYKGLARKLNHKADVYYNGQRVYVFETPFSTDGKRLILKGETVDPEKLTNGHGSPIR